MKDKSTQKVWGAWAPDCGFDLGSFGPTKRSVRCYMIAAERQWLLDEENFTDTQVWGRVNEAGWQLVRASVSRL